MMYGGTGMCGGVHTYGDDAAAATLPNCCKLQGWGLAGRSIVCVITAMLDKIVSVDHCLQTQFEAVAAATAVAISLTRSWRVPKSGGGWCLLSCLVKNVAVLICAVMSRLVTV
jgi:hypothetical protein